MSDSRIGDVYRDPIYSLTTQFDFAAAQNAAEEAERTGNVEGFFRLLPGDQVILLSGDKPHENLRAFNLVQALEQVFGGSEFVKIREYDMGERGFDIRVAEVRIPMSQKNLAILSEIHESAKKAEVVPETLPFVVEMADLNIPEEVLTRARHSRLRRAIEKKLPEKTDQLGDIYVQTKIEEREEGDAAARAYLVKETHRLIKDLINDDRFTLEHYEHHYGDHLEKAYKETKEIEHDTGKIVLDELMWVLSHAVENYRGKAQERGDGDGPAR